MPSEKPITYSTTHVQRSHESPPSIVSLTFLVSPLFLSPLSPFYVFLIRTSSVREGSTVLQFWSHMLLDILLCYLEL